MKKILNTKSLLILCITICILFYLVEDMIKIQSAESNRIYYEYNIINNDTIPIDTVYYPLNKQLPN